MFNEIHHHSFKRQKQSSLPSFIDFMRQPFHQLHPQRSIVDFGMLNHLNHPGNFGISIFMCLAIAFHRPQRVLQRLICIRCVAELQVLVVAEYKAGWVLREREVEV